MPTSDFIDRAEGIQIIFIQLDCCTCIGEEVERFTLIFSPALDYIYQLATKNPNHRVLVCPMLLLRRSGI
jgi:hypothetical protein